MKISTAQDRNLNRKLLVHILKKLIIPLTNFIFPICHRLGQIHACMKALIEIRGKQYIIGYHYFIKAKTFSFSHGYQIIQTFPQH